MNKNLFNYLNLTVELKLQNKTTINKNKNKINTNI